MSGSINSYYAINRILLLSVGLWPYQRTGLRRVLITLITIVLISSIVCQFTTFITTQVDMDLFLKIVAYSIPWLSFTVKYNVLCLNIEKMRNLMDRVRYDWSALNDAREIEIIKSYSAMGRFITLLSILLIYMSMLGFFLLQLVFNFVLYSATAANESRPRELPAVTEYFVDQERYFVPIMLHIFCIVLCGLTTMLATETIYMSYAHHACGLFRIASCRIEQALHKSVAKGVVAAAERNSATCRGIISAVDIHRKAIEFIEMSKANFTIAYFLALPMTVLSLSVNLYRTHIYVYIPYPLLQSPSVQLSRLITTDEYHEIIHIFLFVIGHFWHLFFCNYLGQKVIDHSGDVFHRIYNVRWYMAPLKVQKLLLLVMQRSTRNCTIVIGGLFIPSLEGFATLEKQLDSVSVNVRMAGGKYHFQFTSFITNEFNVDILLHVLAYSVPWMGYTLKYSVFCFNVKKMRDLMERVRCDWNEFSNAQEIEIIKKYSAVGKLMTTGVTCKQHFRTTIFPNSYKDIRFAVVFMYTSISCFVVVQIISNYLYDLATTANESRIRRIPILAEYFVDQEKYYSFIVMHLFLLALSGLSTLVATETLFMSYMQHACGLFEIAKFVDMAMTSFKWAYMMLLPLGVMSLSINLYRFSYLLKSEDYYELIICSMIILGHFIFMLFCNYIGQIVIDHSGNMFDKAYETQWYRASLKVQKLICIVMQRTMRQYVLILGGLFIPSLEGFAGVS
ncbi:uncharacterized protein LOC109860711 [Pseudomyrmex gracilis]|uniref:uncharacterized protein LOC109860711 n=1 Tax=Pseudomyrmex gracilis TaxID=219809 RepID=UPI000994FF8C|nr:uncharacterized protein LOC109860711 [Pseudomyrmex gracilis]